MGDDRFQSVTFGLALGALGTSVAFLVALLRYGDLRLPAGRLYPGVARHIASAPRSSTRRSSAASSWACSWSYDWPPFLAVALPGVLYGLATRLGGPGRNILQLLISLGIGLVSGWLVLATGGIGAAVLGHAITRFAIFLATGPRRPGAPRRLEAGPGRLMPPPRRLGVRGRRLPGRRAGIRRHWPDRRTLTRWPLHPSRCTSTFPSAGASVPTATSRSTPGVPRPGHAPRSAILVEALHVELDLRADAMDDGDDGADGRPAGEG